ncbi:MAG: alpha/beta hydrolase [Thermoplasmatota archaeon]
MSTGSGKVSCPDCGMPLHEKNIAKHYRRRHPGLDPFRRMKEARDARVKKARGPHFETSNSVVIGLLLVLAVVTVMVVASLLVYSIFREDSEAAPPGRTIFYSASDGAIINGTWYASPRDGAETVFLIHDIGRDRTVWNDYAPKLQAEGYNVLAIDLRGHGESTKSIKSEDITYDWMAMSLDDFLDIINDVEAGLKWIKGYNSEGDPNTNAGERSSFIGVGKGGLFAMRGFARFSREGVISGAVLSPTLDSYGLDVEQIFEDWGDVRPIMLAASEGDGTGNLAIDTIRERKEGDGETNGEYLNVPGNAKGIDLLNNNDLLEQINEFLEEGWETKPPS